MEMGRGVARRVSRRQQIDFVPSPVLNSKPTTFGHLGPHRLGRNFLFLAMASFDWLLSFTRSTCQSERRDGPVISFVSNLLADCTYTKRCQLLDNFVKGLLFSSLFSFFLFLFLPFVPFILVVSSFHPEPPSISYFHCASLSFYV